ncbi:MAG: hypothetical protein EZS28_038814, partial [Streblomastix strix]
NDGGSIILRKEKEKIRKQIVLNHLYTQLQQKLSINNSKRLLQFGDDANMYERKSSNRRRYQINQQQSQQLSSLYLQDNESNRDLNKDRKNGNPLSPSPLSPYQSKSKQSLSHSPLKQSSSTSTVQSDADEWVDIEKVEGKMQERIISAEVDIDSPLFLWNLQLKSGKLSGNLNSQLNQAENAGKPGQQSNMNKGSFNNQDDIKRSLVAITPLVLRAQQQKSQKQLQTYTFTSSISSQKSLQQLPPSKLQENNDNNNNITNINRICPSPGTSISPSISSSPYLFRSSPSFTSINYSSYYQQTNQSSFSNYLTLSIPSLQTSLPLIPYANEDYLFLMRIVSISDQKAGNKERFALKQPSKVKVNLNIENIEDLIEQERSEIERENRNMRDGKDKIKEPKQFKLGSLLQNDKEEEHCRI